MFFSCKNIGKTFLIKNVTPGLSSVVFHNPVINHILLIFANNLDFHNGLLYFLATLSLRHFPFPSCLMSHVFLFLFVCMSVCISYTYLHIIYGASTRFIVVAHLLFSNVCFHVESVYKISLRDWIDLSDSCFRFVVFVPI